MAQKFSTWRSIFFITCLIALFYIVTRIVNLTLLPIFTDEAIYIRWSQIGSRDSAWRFISLTDGKQPLYTWITMGFIRIFSDPLFAGRFTSVTAGMVSLVGLGFLSYELFRNRTITILTSLLYILCPFMLLYDRMALYDSLVSALSIWSLYFGIRLVRDLRLDWALILGMILGLGMLNKTSGFLSLYLLPLTLLLFPWGKPGVRKRLIKWCLLVLVSIVVSSAMYSILRLSPFFHIVSQKDSVFVFTISEWMSMPFRFLEGNLRGEFDWVWHYVTIPIFIAALLPMMNKGIHYKEKILLYAWWIVPVVLLANFGKVLYPRFVLFMTVPLLILAATSYAQLIARIKSRFIVMVLIIGSLIPATLVSYNIIFDPVNAAIPKSDRGQFIDDWPSGWGIKEANKFFLEQSYNQSISVYTEGTFGLLPYSLEIYLVDNPNISIHGIWPIPEFMPAEIAQDAINKPTFVVLNQVQIPPATWPLELIAKYQKGRNITQYLSIYRVLPSMGHLSYGEK